LPLISSVNLTDVDMELILWLQVLRWNMLWILSVVGCQLRKLATEKCFKWDSILYPTSRIGTHLPNQLFFQKNVVPHMLILENILQYSFIFSVKKN
jgi:hypothetical protein